MSDSALPSWLGQLSAACGASWPTMERAAASSPEEREKLFDELSGARLIPSDTSVVVFGSLARGEATRRSDLDWALLIDGRVDTEHAEIARQIADIVDKSGKPKPGPTGVFGGLAFSHELVHLIGGDDDTNTNTTRRILLLLESKSINDDAVRERVLRALLDRYVGEDIRYHEPKRFNVPRFLLNDYVRYWRTMGVDSAQKRRDRVEKWALRNIKLRLSRKLIFVAGLWACLSCHLHPSEELQDSRQRNDRDGVRRDMTEFLLGFSQRSPLETLADLFLRYKKHDAAKRSFDAYESFLRLLDDEASRKRLEDLKVEDAITDSTFLEAKRAASEFQHGLSTLFFGADPKLTEATQIYGVF